MKPSQEIYCKFTEAINAEDTDGGLAQLVATLVRSTKLLYAGSG